MKIHSSVILILVLLFQQCGNKNTRNHFSSSDDTLIIRTEKHKGAGLFTSGLTPITFMDSTEELYSPVKLPLKVTNIKRFQIPPDFKSQKANRIELMTGVLNGHDVFIVDQNNNKDFSDDSIRVFKAVNWKSDDELIKCRFLICNGQTIVKDSSWIRIGILYNDIWCGRSEHLTADFTIDKQQFKIGIVDVRLFGFFYGIKPEAALISDNIVIKDTLTEKDILNIGEYFNLNGDYYRFDKITNNGEFITLVKDMSFTTKTGTQVGMIAPEFFCKTVSGDTINSSTLHDKRIIIANSCGCGGDSLSTKAYYDILEEFSRDSYVFRLDSKIKKDNKGFQIDVNESFNIDIYRKYRNEYCSRICYVIGMNNRIIDKFPTTSWRHSLLKPSTPNI